MTRKQIVAALRKKYKRAWIEEYPNALTAAQRLENRRWNQQRKERMDALRKQLSESKHHALAGVLIDAAQFVIDVDGDPTAIDTLRTALSEYRQYHEVRDELRSLAQQRRRPDTGARYRALTNTIISIACLQLAEGDTIAELEDRLRKAGEI